MTGEVEQPMPDAAPAPVPAFDLSKKKKKKKKGVEDPSGVDGVTAALAGQSLNGEGDGGIGMDAGPSASVGQSLDFALPTFGGKKKKKKKKKVDFGDDPLGDADTPSQEEDGRKKLERFHEPQPWDDDQDRDYTYSELINRAFQFLHGKNPALVAGTSQRRRVRMELPQVAREGTKKTVFFNFGSICKSIHRQQDHFLAYLCAELGTTGNIQDGGRLVIKGRFGSEGIANVLKRYMIEYVMCMSCRSPDTVLMRDANTRLYFVSCESCGARRSVTAIRQGFMAQVEKRKK